MELSPFCGATSITVLLVDAAASNGPTLGAKLKYYNRT
jgi:hypothetical protein